MPARTISQRIEQSQHLTASIGIAPNKFVAKLASDLNKPHGITVAPIDPVKMIEWLALLKAGRIWGVGKKMQTLLESMGVITIGDLQAFPLRTSLFPVWKAW